MVDPAEVASALGFKVPDAMQFCEEVLTEVNAHNAALLLAALRAGDYDACHRILEIDKAMETGPLDGPEADRIEEERLALMAKFP